MYKRITCSLPLLTIIIFSSLTTLSQQKRIDSLNFVVEQKKGIDKYEPIINLVRESAITNDKEAYKLILEAEKIAYAFSDSSKIVNSSRIIAQLLNRLGQAKEAERILIQTIPIAKRNNFRDEYKRMLNNLALAYTIQAKYDKALIKNFQTLELWEKDKNEEETSISLNNIGLVYYKLKNYEKALEFYNAALILKKRIHDNYSLERLLTNIGLCYNGLKKFSKAKPFFLKAFELCKENCSEHTIIEAMLGLGVYYYETGIFSEALNSFEKSYSAAKKIEDKRFEAETLLCLARTSIKIKKSSPIKLLNECQKISIAGNYKEILIEVYKNLSELYAEANDFRSTANYQNKYIQLKDSIYSEELTQNLMVAQAEYEQRENKAQIDSQRQMLFLKEEVITRQNWINSLAGITVALMITLVFLLYRSNLQKKRVNLLLEQKVKERTLELENKYVSIQQTYQAQTNLVLKSSHSMRGPVSTMKGLCLLALKELPYPEVKIYLKQFEITSQQLMDSINKLLRDIQ